MIYEGREGGTDSSCGEAEAIFYSKIRFTLIDSGTFWALGHARESVKI